MRYILTLVVFVFLSMEKASAKGYRGAIINAGGLISIKENMPSGPGFDYLKLLTERAGYPIQSWNEMPLARNMKANRFSKVDFVFPYFPQGRRKISIVELGKLSIDLFTLKPIKKDKKLYIGVRNGVSTFLKLKSNPLFPILKSLSYREQESSSAWF